MKNYSENLLKNYKENLSDNLPPSHVVVFTDNAVQFKLFASSSSTRCLSEAKMSIVKNYAVKLRFLWWKIVKCSRVDDSDAIFYCSLFRAIALGCFFLLPLLWSVQKLRPWRKNEIYLKRGNKINCWNFTAAKAWELLKLPRWRRFLEKMSMTKKIYRWMDWNVI